MQAVTILYSVSCLLNSSPPTERVFFLILKCSEGQHCSILTHDNSTFTAGRPEPDKNLLHIFYTKNSLLPPISTFLELLINRSRE